MNEIPILSESPALFVFQSKGIQNFLLGSDRLRDMVGATEIVDQLPTVTLEKLLSELGLHEKQDYQRISQAAGSARLLFKREADARRLGQIWPMVSAYAAPDMEMVQTVRKITNGDFFAAANGAERELAVKRNQPPVPLPEIMPPVLRVRRTGLAAVERDADDENQEIDNAMRAKRKARRVRLDKRKLPTIFTRFGLEDTNANLSLVPEEMAHIAGKNNSWLAVVHVDGNGVGQMYINLQKELSTFAGKFDAPAFSHDLSDGLIQAGDNAAAAALTTIRPRFNEITEEDEHWPLLPVVVAGDDLTVILRAELAVPFAQTFLAKFEEQCRILFQSLVNKERDSDCRKLLKDALGPCLTAGAGIAFIKPRYPFSAAYHLCESLAGFAKRIAKDPDHWRADGLPPSTLAFHVASGASVREDFDDLLQSELLSLATGVKLSFAPYAVGQNARNRRHCLPTLDQLYALASAVHRSRLPRGQVRHLLYLLREEVLKASRHLDRFLASSADKKAKEARDDFQAALKALTGDGLLDDSRPHPRTPLLDALTLADVASASA